MFRFPYRWRWGTVWSNLRSAYWDIHIGVQNICKFGSAVWFFNSCDYSSLLELMEIATREMRNLHRDHGNTLMAPKIERQLTVVSELCRRLREDNYFENCYGKNWDQLSDFEQTRIAKHSGKQAKNDAQYLGKMFRFVQWWWD